MKIKFHSEARKIFFEAVDYNEEQVVGLGDVFIDEVGKEFKKRLVNKFIEIAAIKLDSY